MCFPMLQYFKNSMCNSSASQCLKCKQIPWESCLTIESDSLYLLNDLRVRISKSFWGARASGPQSTVGGARRHRTFSDPWMCEGWKWHVGLLALNRKLPNSSHFIGKITLSNPSDSKGPTILWRKLTFDTWKYDLPKNPI